MKNIIIVECISTGKNFIEDIINRGYNPIVLEPKIAETEEGEEYRRTVYKEYERINYDFDTVNKPMFIDNLKDIKEYCDNIICFYSDNDPYVKFEAEKTFADTISEEQHVIKNGGHINAESGYTSFEEILKVI